MLLGALVAGLGGWHLVVLERSYLRNEVLYRGSPDTLLLWLTSLDLQAPDTADRITGRLLLMPLPQRRIAVLALAGNDIWTKLAPKPQDQRGWQRVSLKATQDALARAPMAGDLWLLAGVLDGRLSGYGQSSQRSLVLSASYAPRELELVGARLAVLATAWPLLDEELKDVVRRDLAVAELAAPDRARVIRELLQRAGAQLDD